MSAPARDFEDIEQARELLINLADRHAGTHHKPGDWTGPMASDVGLALSAMTHLSRLLATTEGS